MFGCGLTRAIILSAALLCVSGRASANDARSAISVSTVEIFERLLASAATSPLDAERVRKYLNVLQPLLEEVDRTFGAQLEREFQAALAQGSSEQLLVVSQRFISLAVSGLLRASCPLAADRPVAVPKIKQAYAEYLVLDGYVRSRNFDASKVIVNDFRKANTTAGVRPEEFVTVCHRIEATLERFFSPR